MKIAFFGTGEFSANILKGMIESNEFEIPFVVSQSDKKVGRKQEIQETAVKVLAKEHGIKVLQPEKIKSNNEFFEELRSYNLDFIIVVAYGKIIPKAILEIPKYSVINIHGSILPKYRGASPIQESIKNGDIKTGITIMKMSEGMDEGDILLIQEIDIDINDKTEDVFKKFELIGTNILINALKGFISGEIKGEKQDDIKATYCGKINKEDGKIDFNLMTAKQIYDLYRAYSKWPGIFSYYNGKKISFEDCFFNEENYNKKGEVIKQNGQIGIVCKTGVLIIKKVKLEGKKEMNILDFINGNKEFIGYVFN